MQQRIPETATLNKIDCAGYQRHNNIQYYLLECKKYEQQGIQLMEYMTDFNEPMRMET